MTRDARDMPLVWIDGEMTGLDPREDLLLEIAVVVTDAELNELGSFEAVLHQDRNLAVRMMDPEVLRMHTRSGLIADLAVTTSETSIEAVERQLIDFVHLHDAAGAPAAGSSIAFDRGFLAVVMPDLNDLLHYRSVDVSTVKELGRRFAPEVLASAPVKERPHRALADVRESIAELRHYVRAGMFRAAPRAGVPSEQIEAAAKAGVAPQVAGGDHAALLAEARSRAEHPGTGSNTAQCLRECADALEAATGAVVTADHEADADRMYPESEMTYGWGAMQEAYLEGVRSALAAPVQVDEVKLADVIANAYASDSGRLQGVNRHGERAARAVAEWLRGGGR